MAMFGKVGWETTVKEASFTAPLNNAVSLHSEAMQGGNSGIAGKNNTIVEVHQASKCLLKALRSLSRAKDKPNRYRALTVWLETIRDYCKSIGITTVASFDLMVAKSLFYKAAAAVDNDAGTIPSLAETLTRLIDGQLLSSLTEHTEDKKRLLSCVLPSAVAQ